MGHQTPVCDAHVAQPATATESGAPSAKVEPKLSWWWSRDDERFHGPNHSKADAIMNAWADDPDQGAYICRAASGEWRTNFIEWDWLAEAFDEVNEEVSDPDGDGPSTLLSDGDWKKLAERLNQSVRAAIRDKGLTSWGFAHQHPSEYVDIPTMWKAAEAAEAESLAVARERSETVAATGLEADPGCKTTVSSRSLGEGG